MRAVIHGGVAAVLCLAPRTAAAQDACAGNLKWPTVGQWAEYKGTRGQTNPITSRYAVVGTERRNGNEYKWIEMKMRDVKTNRNMIYQMLVPGGVLDMGEVQEVVMKPEDQPAMKMSGMMINAMRSQLAKNSAFSDACKDAILVGSEKVSVPAGSFTARHYHSDKYGTDTWIVPAAPFPLVRTTGKDFAMDLVATGTGATSSITETPKEMGKP